MQDETTTSQEEKDVEKSVDQTVDDSGKTMDEINAEIEKELEEGIEQEEKSREQQLEEEVAELKNKLLRSVADLENYRKRSARDKADAIRYGNQRLFEDLLPVIDNFAMGMMASEQDSGSMIYMGMQMVQKQLDDFLENQGVQEVALKPGDDFDPNLHDALNQEVSDEFEEGKVIRVMRKGYKMGDRLIRPANVVVAKAAEEAPAEDTAPAADAADATDSSEQAES